MIMDIPMLTWSCVVGLFILIVFVRLAHGFRVNAKGGHKLLELGSEREVFFIPGDPVKPEEYDDDCEE